MFLKFQICIFILLSCFLVLADQTNQEDLNKKLFHAVRKGNAKDVKKLLTAGADPNIRDEKGETPLHNPYLPFEIAGLLLEKGADPNIRDKKGKTPLHNTLLPLETASLLLEAGADPNIRDEKGETPLHNQYLRPETVSLYLKAGADPNIRNKKGEIPLHNEFLPPETARLHLTAGADPNTRDHEGNLPNIVKQYPSLLESSPQLKKEKKTSCRYITQSSQIKAVQCGRRSICMAEASCIFEVGDDSDKAQIERTFQTVCSSLSDGQCPKADDCVLDRSVMAEGKNEIKNRPHPSAPQSSSTGVR